MEISNKVSKVNTEPLISIIVPAYNIEAYLPRCLDSIMSQTYQNIEIVLVDDGSKDMSGQIADDYNVQYPGRFQVLHLENGGVTQARLTGIAAANGEWIGFVDGDDVIEPDMYRRLLKNAQQYGADISHCGYQTIVNEGERVHYFYNTGRLVQQDRISGLKDLLSGSFVEPGLWNKLFHKTLFHSLLHSGAMDCSLRYNEDLLMNYLLFSETDTAVYEDFCPYHYLVRKDSATRVDLKVNDRKMLDPVKVWEWILQHKEPELESIIWRKYLVRCYEAYVALFHRKDLKNEIHRLKSILLNNRDKWALLQQREKIKLRLALTSPKMFRSIYWLYEKTLQKKIYE